MEKYVRIGVAAVIIAAAVLVGAIMFAKTPKEESKADVQELNLDEDAKKKVDVTVQTPLNKNMVNTPVIE